MFCVITNIYNKKTEGSILMETVTRKLKTCFFLQLEMFVDFFGLCRTLARNHSTSSSAFNLLAPELFF